MHLIEIIILLIPYYKIIPHRQYGPRACAYCIYVHQYTCKEYNTSSCSVVKCAIFAASLQQKDFCIYGQ